MSITIHRADIVCDKCAAGLPLPGHMGMTAFRRWAKGMGWDSTTGKDYCPSCNPNRKPKQLEKP